MNKIDANILGKVYTYLLTYGSGTKDQIQQECKIGLLDTDWALYQMRCRFKKGVYHLHENMRPRGWDWLSQDAPDNERRERASPYQ